jgi:glutamate N-acetyltransferase/amino-acid N-acetyltransferase
MPLATRIDGGVTTPRGFKASGIAAGIKKAEGALDLSVIAADSVVSAAAVFTTNKAKAAPILLSERHLQQSGGRARAVVVNSGCANACTGEAGMAHARQMAGDTATALQCKAENILVASTGVIGVQLPIDRVSKGISAAVRQLSTEGSAAASRAIMTTDPFPKTCAAIAGDGAARITVGGMAKGSGMIEPRMATMLGFLTIDAAIEPHILGEALRNAVNETFNAITVDGECSTNDCVFAMASGTSGVRVTHADDPVLSAALVEVAGYLAREIVRGGEGATTLVTVRVIGAATYDDAWLAARTIANSPLVKTAINGGDPNWGRLIAAAGRSGAAFVLDGASVSIGPVHLFVRGVPHDERASEAATHLEQDNVDITVDLGTGGSHAATMWTCDFSAEYVRINAEYRT